MWINLSIKIIYPFNRYLLNEINILDIMAVQKWVRPGFGLL